MKTHGGVRASLVAQFQLFWAIRSNETCRYPCSGAKSFNIIRLHAIPIRHSDNNAIIYTNTIRTSDRHSKHRYNAHWFRAWIIIITHAMCLCVLAFGVKSTVELMAVKMTKIMRTWTHRSLQNLTTDSIENLLSFVFTTQIITIYIHCLLDE